MTKLRLLSLLVFFALIGCSDAQLNSAKTPAFGKTSDNHFELIQPYIAFQYPDSWSKPHAGEVSEGGTGELLNISFPYGKAGWQSAADIWLETADYDPGGHDFRLVCFSCITFSGEEEKFLRYMGYHVSELDTILIGGKKALRVIGWQEPTMKLNEDDLDPPPQISYYVPFATGNYHMQIHGPVDKTEMMDEFVRTIRFE